MKKYVYCLIFSLFTFLPLSAQLKINFGGDSPLRKDGGDGYYELLCGLCE